MASDIIYKVTLSNGVAKIGSPQRLAALKGTYSPARAIGVRVIKVERAVVNNWTDVTARYIEGYQYPEPSPSQRQIAWALAWIKENYGPPEG